MDTEYLKVDDLDALAQETATLHFVNAGGQSCQVTEIYEDGASLNLLAYQFKRYLQAAGFDFIAEVHIITTSGDVWNSQDD